MSDFPVLCYEWPGGGGGGGGGGTYVFKVYGDVLPKWVGFSWEKSLYMGPYFSKKILTNGVPFGVLVSTPILPLFPAK